MSKKVVVVLAVIALVLALVVAGAVGFLWYRNTHVFVEGKAIAFRNEKSKELLALLVDRRGGFVTSSEAISYLWEDEEVSQLTLARYRKVALRLKNLLEEYGIAHIVETVDGKRRIVPQNVSCDLFDCLAGQRELFKGSYLLNYSWGEVTAAELLGE